MLLEGNPYYLALTFAVSVLHSVFDMLAFKNDIGFWKDKKSVEGLSIKTILINCGCQARPRPGLRPPPRPLPPAVLPATIAGSEWPRSCALCSCGDHRRQPLPRRRPFFWDSRIAWLFLQSLLHWRARPLHQTAPDTLETG